jgi:hypothetical protein
MRTPFDSSTSSPLAGAGQVGGPLSRVFPLKVAMNPQKKVHGRFVGSSNSWRALRAVNT